jgi:hypothetical protein
MNASPLAGKPADIASLVHMPKLIDSYYSETLVPSVAVQQVPFGTSGHRSSAYDKLLTNDISWPSVRRLANTENGRRRYAGSFNYRFLFRALRSGG